VTSRLFLVCNISTFEIYRYVVWSESDLTQEWTNDTMMISVLVRVI